MTVLKFKLDKKSKCFIFCLIFFQVTVTSYNKFVRRLNTSTFNVCRGLYHGMCKNLCKKFFKLTSNKITEPLEAFFK